MAQGALPTDVPALLGPSHTCHKCDPPAARWAFQPHRSYARVPRTIRAFQPADADVGVGGQLQALPVDRWDDDVSGEPDSAAQLRAPRQFGMSSATLLAARRVPPEAREQSADVVEAGGNAAAARALPPRAEAQVGDDGEGPSRGRRRGGRTTAGALAVQPSRGPEEEAELGARVAVEGGGAASPWRDTATGEALPLSVDADSAAMLQAEAEAAAAERLAEAEQAALVQGRGGSEEARDKASKYRYRSQRLFRPLELAWLDADYEDLQDGEHGRVVRRTPGKGGVEVALPSHARPPRYSRRADAVPLAAATTWEGVDKLLRRNYDILEPALTAAAWSRIAQLDASPGDRLLPRLTRLTREMLPDMSASQLADVMAAVGSLGHRDRALLAGLARELLLREPYHDLEPRQFVRVLRACAALDAYEAPLLDVVCQYLVGVPTVRVLPEEGRSKQQRREEVATAVSARRVKGVNLREVGEAAETLAPVGGGATKRWLDSREQEGAPRKGGRRSRKEADDGATGGPSWKARGEGTHTRADEGAAHARVDGGGQTRGREVAPAQVCGGARPQTRAEEGGYARGGEVVPVHVSGGGRPVREDSSVGGYVLEPGVPQEGLNNSADTVTLTRAEVTARRDSTPDAAAAIGGSARGGEKRVANQHVTDDAASASQSEGNGDVVGRADAGVDGAGSIAEEGAELAHVRGGSEQAEEVAAGMVAGARQRGRDERQPAGGDVSTKSARDGVIVQDDVSRPQRKVRSRARSLESVAGLESEEEAAVQLRQQATWGAEPTPQLRRFTSEQVAHVFTALAELHYSNPHVWDALATRVVRGADLATWPTAHVVAVVQACGVMGYRNNVLALAATRQLLASRSLLSAGMADMAGAMHGLGHMTFRHNDQESLFGSYAEAMLNNPHLLEDVAPAQVQQVLVGCGLTSYAHPRLFDALTAQLARGPLLSLFGADDVTALVYGLAKCGLNSPPLVAAVAAHIARSISVVAFRKDDLPRLLFGFGVLGARGEEVDHVVGQVLHHVAAFELLPTWQPHQLTMALLGAARSGVCDDGFWEAALHVVADPSRQAALQIRQIATLLTCFTQQRSVPPARLDGVLDGLTDAIHKQSLLRDASMETVAALLTACARLGYREAALHNALAARLGVLAGEGAFDTWVNPELLLGSLRAVLALGGMRSTAAKLLLNQLLANPLRLRRLTGDQIADVSEAVAFMQYRRPRLIEPLTRHVAAHLRTRAGDGILAGEIPPRAADPQFTTANAARCLAALGKLHYRPAAGLPELLAAVADPAGVRDVSEAHVLGVLEAVAALQLPDGHVQGVELASADDARGEDFTGWPAVDSPHLVHQGAGAGPHVGEVPRGVGPDSVEEHPSLAGAARHVASVLVGELQRRRQEAGLKLGRGYKLRVQRALQEAGIQLEAARSLMGPPAHMVGAGEEHWEGVTEEGADAGQELDSDALAGGDGKEALAVGAAS